MKLPARPPSARTGAHAPATYLRRYSTDTLGAPVHGRYIAVSQSEFSRWHCPRQALFSVVEGLRTAPSLPMLIGTAWDAWKRDVWTWWMERDATYPASGLSACVWCAGAGCARCDGGRSALDTALNALDAGGRFDPEEVEQTAEMVRRMADGWIAYYEGGRLDDWEVAGVQVPIARAVPGLDGSSNYAPVVYLTEAEPVAEETPLGFTVQAARWRLSRTGEHGQAVRWPWYQFGILDVVLRHRTTRVALVLDDKATSQPGHYADAIRVDPQLPGYCWMLEPLVERLGCSRVAGFTYEATSTTYQRDPELLKPILPSMDELKAMASERGVSTKGLNKAALVEALGIDAAPAMSRASTGQIPSWRYVRALEAAGIDPADYADHIESLRVRVDDRLYLRGLPALLPYSAEVGARYARELHARVARIAEARRAAALVTDPRQLDVSFPRVPICRMSRVRCAYEGPCTQGADATAAPGFDIETDQVWQVPTKN